MKKNRNKKRWYVIVAIVIVLVVVTFSPIILSPGRIEPKFLSLPFTLWSGMLLTIVVVILTYLASRIQDKD